MRYTKIILLFLGLTLVYSAWMTGCTFRFQETVLFPHYGMLAESLAAGRLDIISKAPVDMASINGKNYFYWGPVPAVVRLPFLILVGIHIPTGLMVVLYTAGICVFFALLLGELASASESRLAGSAGVVFVVTFVLNGYVWFMVMVPSIHHEAVCASAFFLMIAVYYAIKVVRNQFAMKPSEAAVVGAALGLAFGSRLTAVVAAMFLTAVLLIGMHLNGTTFRQQRRLVSAGIVILFPTVAAVALMLYNYARFGSIMEVGHKYGASIYSQYILSGHAMRYDHIPYNLWDYFCRIPSAMTGFPYLDMQLSILDVRSRLGPAYHLIHYNELAVSVFWMMPILLFAFAPLSHRLIKRSGVPVKSYWILVGVVVLQTLCASLFMGSAARYAFDFLPFLTAMSFLGLVMLKSDDRSILVLVVFTAVLSTILGVALVGNAFVSYFPFIRYPSPWLR